MILQQVNELLDYHITSGSEYLWDCFPNARYMDYESDHAHVSILFSIYTQEVYCAEVNDTNLNYAYRWINPDYKDDMIEEARTKGVDPDIAWDDVKWYDLETEEDFLDKALAIFNGEEFDTRIQVPLELDDDMLLKLCQEAHKRDITLNQLVEDILRYMIAQHEQGQL